MASDSYDTLHLCLSPIRFVLMVGLCAQGMVALAQPTGREALRDLPEVAADQLLPDGGEPVPQQPASRPWGQVPWGTGESPEAEQPMLRRPPAWEYGSRAAPPPPARDALPREQRPGLEEPPPWERRWMLPPRVWERRDRLYGEGGFAPYEEWNAPRDWRGPGYGGYGGAAAPGPWWRPPPWAGDPALYEDPGIAGRGLWFPRRWPYEPWGDYGLGWGWDPWSWDPFYEPWW